MKPLEVGLFFINLQRLVEYAANKVSTLFTTNREWNKKITINIFLAS